MNGRIRELAEQAGFQYIKDEGIGWAGNHNSSLSKFAELIVEECAQRAEAYAYMSQNFNALAEELRRMIGVK